MDNCNGRWELITRARSSWGITINPLKPNSSNYYILLYRPNIPFLMSDTERQSAQVSEIKNGRLGLYGAKHLKCHHMMTLDFKGLTPSEQDSWVSYALQYLLVDYHGWPSLRGQYVTWRQNSCMESWGG